jgi:transcriptional regulator with GAF, ATPase, and Fis domain
MTEDREREVAGAFVSLASSLATGYDVVDLLNSLTAECARLLDVASAGLLLADSLGVLHVLAASSEHTRQLELFQLQREEGPCLDCYRTRQAIAVPDLAAAADRWPQFVAGARLAGFASVHALPMRLRDNVLGTLGLFGTTVGALNEEDLTLGQALADVASVALVQNRAAADKNVVNEQLQTALTSRVVIEQAKGVLAQLGESDMADAFVVLRRYSRDHNLRLTDVAQAVVSRTIPAHQLLEYARSRAVPKA